MEASSGTPDLLAASERVTRNFTCSPEVYSTVTMSPAEAFGRFQKTSGLPPWLMWPTRMLAPWKPGLGQPGSAYHPAVPKGGASTFSESSWVACRLASTSSSPPESTRTRLGLPSGARVLPSESLVLEEEGDDDALEEELELLELVDSLSFVSFLGLCCCAFDVLEGDVLEISL